jgi:hypothetical protein
MHEWKVLLDTVARIISQGKMAESETTSPCEAEAEAQLQYDSNEESLLYYILPTLPIDVLVDPDYWKIRINTSVWRIHLTIERDRLHTACNNAVPPLVYLLFMCRLYPRARCSFTISAAPF